MGEGGFERHQSFENPEEGSEVLLSDAEIDFFKQYGQGEGYKKSLAVARVLNAPHSNIEIPPDRQSDLRQNTGGFTQSERMPKRPELGGFEYHTASIMAREFNKTIDKAKEEGTFKDGDVSIAVLDDGEHKWLNLQQYTKRRDQGTEDLRILATVASIDGDDEEGPTILVRSDMDALQMATDEVKHQCGHNVHSGWAVSNVEALKAYKEKFGHLPFKKIVFVSEANEEANPEAGELVSPRELKKAGFEDRYGKTDIVLGAHVIASIPENTVRIEEGGTFHGATDYIYTVKPTDNYEAGRDNDIRRLPAEVARLVNEKYGSDQPSEKFGKRQLVKDKGDVVPTVYVRTTAMQEATSAEGDSYNNLSINSLAATCRYEGQLAGSELSKEHLQDIVELKLNSWRDAGFNISGQAEVDSTSGKFFVEIDAGEPAHVGLGGPNPQQIMGEILNEASKESGIVSQEQPSGIKFGGTMRIREVEHKQIKEEAERDLQAIMEQAINNLGLQGKVESSFVTQNSVSPTINNENMAKQAKAVMERAGVESSQANVPHAGAESFAEYESFLDGDRKKMLYIQVGGMKKDRADQYLKSGEPVDLDCVHHSDTFNVQDSAMGYGVSLDALAIQHSRAWKKEKNQND